MPHAFPLYVYLNDCECIIIGGGSHAAHSAETLLLFGARVTVISPALCPALRELDKAGRIRYIPRKYFRGDCTPATLCVAATNSDAVNISVAEECKAKGIPVNLSHPASYSTYVFPCVALGGDLTLSAAGKLSDDEAVIRSKLEAMLSQLTGTETPQEQPSKPKKPKKSSTQP